MRSFCLSCALALIAITGQVAESTFGIEPTMNLILLTFLAFALVFRRHRAIGHDLGDVGALLPQLVGDDLSANVRVGQQHLQAADVRGRRDGAHGCRLDDASRVC